MCGRGARIDADFQADFASSRDWSSVIKWWRGVFHAAGTEVTDSLTSLELELEWALECPDTSRVYFTKCSWPEQEKSGERGGKKWKRWGKMKRGEEGRFAFHSRMEMGVAGRVIKKKVWMTGRPRWRERWDQVRYLLVVEIYRK